MKRLIRICVALFVMTAVIAAPVAALDCDHEHEADCATACPCVCHGSPSITDNGLCSFQRHNVAVYVRVTEVLSQGILIPADIFRPPACA